MSLASVFTTDINGGLRGMGAGWDVGAFEYGGAAPSPTPTPTPSNQPPVVSAIGQNAIDTDIGVPGIQILEGTVVQYSGSASDPNGNPLTWKWIYTVNGGAEVILQSGSGAVLPALYSYGANTAGKTYVWKLRVSDGNLTSESQLTVGVVAPPPPAAGLTFEAESGSITAPFVVSNGYISQSSLTGVTNGGRAAYNFNIATTGDYVIQGVVDGPNDGANSFFINIDAEPQDPAMIWHIPLTNGLESRIVSWEGNGTWDKPQFVPKVFHLDQGSHQLIIRGREANTRLDRFSILKLPTTVQNLRLISP